MIGVFADWWLVLLRWLVWLDYLKWLLCRCDFQVKLNGFRVELNEIEAVVQELAPIAKAVATVQDQQLVMFVVPAPGGEIDVELGELVKKQCVARLPPYMTPSIVLTIEQIPLSSNGKLDQGKLAHAASAPPTATFGAPLERARPTSSKEQQILNIATIILPTRDLHMETDFFLAGGNSFLAVRFVTLLNKELGCNLPASDILRYRVLRSLATHVHAMPSLTPNIVPLTSSADTTGGTTNIFLIHGVGGTAFSFSELAHSLHELCPSVMVYAFQSIRDSSLDQCTMKDIAAAYFQQMKLIQPKGPYNLVGWSFGGHICYEIALSCFKSGNKADIGQMVFIDTFSAQFQFPVDPGNIIPESRILRQFIIDLLSEHGGEFNITPEMDNLSSREVLGFLQTAGLFADLEQLFEVYRQNTSALWSYRPETPPGQWDFKPVLLKANSLLAGFEIYTHVHAKDLGWGLSVPGVQVIECAGNHYSMVTQPEYGKQLARRINEILMGHPCDVTKTARNTSDGLPLIWRLSIGDLFLLFINFSKGSIQSLCSDLGAATDAHVLTKPPQQSDDEWYRHLLRLHPWKLVIKLFVETDSNAARLLQEFSLLDTNAQLFLVYMEGQLAMPGIEQVCEVVSECRGKVDRIGAHVVHVKCDLVQGLSRLLADPECLIGQDRCMISFDDKDGFMVHIPETAQVAVKLAAQSVPLGDIQARLMSHVLNSTGITVEIDSVLMESGIDSLSSTDLVQALRRDFGKDSEVSQSMFFSKPTIREIALHLHQAPLPHTEFCETSDYKTQIQVNTRPIMSIIGMACVLGGGVTTPAQLWSTLLTSSSCINRSPPSRWRDVCTQDSAPTSLCTGAFIYELEVLLPQTKDRSRDLHLESVSLVTLAALNDVGIDHQSTDDRQVGMFTACATLDFAIPCPAYMVSRLIAKDLGFEGPHENVEATCSSGYIGILRACDSLSSQACSTAVAAASSLMLQTQGYLTERMVSA